MAIQALLPMLGAMGSGAMSGISSKLGMSKEKKMEPLQTPEQKAQARASQALIPFYLQMISGQMPDFLKRNLMQTRGTLEASTRGIYQTTLDRSDLTVWTSARSRQPP